MLHRERPGQESFHIEDLAVRCWEMFPDRFGMKRHALPNMNTVASKIPTLVRENWLARVAESEYALGTRGPMWRRRNLTAQARGETT